MGSGLRDIANIVQHNNNIIVMPHAWSFAIGGWEIRLSMRFTDVNEYYSGNHKPAHNGMHIILPCCM